MGSSPAYYPMNYDETPLVIVRNELVIDFFNVYNRLGFKRRTVQGLSNNVGELDTRVKTTLERYSDIFTSVVGCKGEMWILNKIGDC